MKTITLNIPEGQRIGESIWEAIWRKVDRETKKRERKFGVDMGRIHRVFCVASIIEKIEDQDLLSLLEKAND